MNNNTFNFSLIDIVPFKKGDTKMARIVCYCSYGFLVNLFTTEQKAVIIKEKAKNNNGNITNFVAVFYDNKENKFKYVVNDK